MINILHRVSALQSCAIARSEELPVIMFYRSVPVVTLAAYQNCADNNNVVQRRGTKFSIIQCRWALLAAYQNCTDNNNVVQRRGTKFSIIQCRRALLAAYQNCVDNNNVVQRWGTKFSVIQKNRSHPWARPCNMFIILPLYGIEIQRKGFEKGFLILIFSNSSGASPVPASLERQSE